VDVIAADLSSSAGAAAALAAIDAKYGPDAITSVVSSFGGIIAYGVDFSAVGDAAFKQAIEVRGLGVLLPVDAQACEEAGTPVSGGSCCAGQHAPLLRVGHLWSAPAGPEPPRHILHLHHWAGRVHGRPGCDVSGRGGADRCRPHRTGGVADEEVQPARHRAAPRLPGERGGGRRRGRGGGRVERGRHRHHAEAGCR